MTFRVFADAAADGKPFVPTATAWSLAELGQALGKQELFTRQSPQRLKVLREHALVESAISSNRIEGVEVDQSRVATLVFGKPVLRDRDEEEVRGYRDALDLIHTNGQTLRVTEETVRELHRRIRGQSWDAGQYKQKTEPIIERYADGRSRVRFMPVEAGAATEAAMAELVDRAQSAAEDGVVHPLIALGAFGLDFLCVHRFRDGNGRVARLLMLLQSYHAGLEVGRYISLERVIEQNKDRYYKTLEQSSQGWHDGRHNPWAFINYVLFILKEAYREFESRVGETADEQGSKAQLVREAVRRERASFRLADIEQACPGVGRDWIRKVLRQMRDEGEIDCEGHGAGARWQRNKGNTPK